ISVDLNLDSSNAIAIRTFTNTQNSTDITFQAGTSRQGAQGNSIVVNLTKQHLGVDQAPKVTFTGTNNNTINVVLNLDQVSGFAGTTASQLADAINLSPANNNIITVDPGGQPDLVISGTLISSVQLAGGADPSTAQQVVDAINSAAGNIVQ